MYVAHIYVIPSLATRRVSRRRFTVLELEVRPLGLRLVHDAHHDHDQPHQDQCAQNSPFGAFGHVAPCAGGGSGLRYVTRRTLNTTRGAACRDPVARLASKLSM